MTFEVCRKVEEAGRSVPVRLTKEEFVKMATKHEEEKRKKKFQNRLDLNSFEGIRDSRVQKVNRMRK